LSRRVRAFANILSLQLSRVLSKIFSVFFIAIAARYLGTGGFGQWSLVFLLIGFFGLLADYGLDRMTVRDVARDLDLSRQYLTNTLTFKLLAIVPVTGLFLGLIHFAGYPRETVELLLIAIPILFLNVLSTPFSSIIQAHERIYWVSIVDIVQGFASSAIGVAILLLGFGIRGLLIMAIGFAFVRFIALWWITRRLIGNIWYPISLRFMRALIGRSFPFAVLGILAVIQMKADYFLISKMLGAEQLGLYAAAFKIFENIIMMGMAVNAALYPSVSALFGESRERLRRVYERMQKFFVIVAIPVAIFIFVFAHEIISLMYGQQYLDSVSVLIIFSLCFAILFPTIPMRLVINNSELLMKTLPYSVVMTILNIGLNLFVIPRYGIIGAAVVSFLAGSADVWIRIHFIRLIFPEDYHPVRVVWRPIIAAAICVSIIIVFSDLGRPLSAVLGFAVYIFSLHLMGEVGIEEYRLFVREPMVRILSFLAKRQSI